MQRILSYIRKAVDEYNMIDEKDKIVPNNFSSTSQQLLCTFQQLESAFSLSLRKRI